MALPPPASRNGSSLTHYSQEATESDLVGATARGIYSGEVTVADDHDVLEISVIGFYGFAAGAAGTESSELTGARPREMAACTSTLRVELLSRPRFRGQDLATAGHDVLERKEHFLSG